MAIYNERDDFSACELYGEEGPGAQIHRGIGVMIVSGCCALVAGIGLALYGLGRLLGRLLGAA